MARSDPIEEASFPDIRARSSPGTAMAAMMPMMATTMRSSMRVKPLLVLVRMVLLPEAESFRRNLVVSKWLFVFTPMNKQLSCQHCLYYVSSCLTNTYMINKNKFIHQ